MISKDMLKKYDLFSFDIFDTLLFRTCKRPTDLFWLIGERAHQLGYLKDEFSNYEFQQLRIMAESEARKRKMRDSRITEINLKEVYQCMPKFLGNIQQIYLAELAVETEACYINPEGRRWLEEIRAVGKPIVLVSDMYLSEGEIRKLLKTLNFPLHMVDKIYVSNEYGCTKGEGKLFKILLSDYPHILPERMLHVGDLEQVDVLGAQKAGLEASLYSVASWDDYHIFEWERVYSDRIIPELETLRKQVCYQERENPWFCFGAATLGPFLAIFVEWIIDICLREGRKNIYPFMREGQILGQLLINSIAQRKADINVKPIYVSRQATVFAAIEHFNLESIYHLFDRRNFTLRNLFVSLDLMDGLEIFKPYWEVQVQEADKIYISNQISLKDQVISYLLTPESQVGLELFLKSKRDLLLQYLQQECGSFQNAITVDLGFRGTMQFAIDKACQLGNIPERFIHLIGLGADSVKIPLIKGSDIRGFAANAGLYAGLMQTITRSPFILEQMLLAPCGSTLGYCRENDQVVPCLDSYRFGQEELQRKSCWQGILAFQQAWFELNEQKPRLKEKIFLNRESWIQMIHRLVSMPTAKEAKYLGSLIHEDNFGSDFSNKICSEKDLEQARCMDLQMFLNKCQYGAKSNYDYTKVAWPQGVVSQIDPTFLYEQALLRQEDSSYFSIMSRIMSRLKKQGIMQIVGYGAGEVGRALVQAAKLYQVEVAALVDQKESLWGKRVDEVPVISLSDIKDPKVVFVIASISAVQAIKENITKYVEESWQVKPIIFSSESLIGLSENE